MDVIRDRQIAVLTERNLEFLTEQVRAARSRFEVGEGTRTDVAQAEASRSAAVAQLSAARAQAQSSAAIYRQIVGDEPGKLRPARRWPSCCPRASTRRSRWRRSSIRRSSRPSIWSMRPAFPVKSAEGALLPQLSAIAGVSRRLSANTVPAMLSTRRRHIRLRPASAATLTVPIYQGGRASAQVRQSKESLGQARIEVDVSRDQVRQAVTSAWTQYTAALRKRCRPTASWCRPQQLALNGVIEERNVGQRTTLDVLNAQADVITAQINLVSSERDVVVASYAILSAVGRLSARTAGAAVSPNTSPKSTTTPSRTSGSACARPTAAEPFQKLAAESRVDARSRGDFESCAPLSYAVVIDFGSRFSDGVDKSRHKGGGCDDGTGKQRAARTFHGRDPGLDPADHRRQRYSAQGGRGQPYGRARQARQGQPRASGTVCPRGRGRGVPRRSPLRPGKHAGEPRAHSGPRAGGAAPGGVSGGCVGGGNARHRGACRASDSGRGSGRGGRGSADRRRGLRGNQFRRAYCDGSAAHCVACRGRARRDGARARHRAGAQRVRAGAGTRSGGCSRRGFGAAARRGANRGSFGGARGRRSDPLGLRGAPGGGGIRRAL